MTTNHFSTIMDILGNIYGFRRSGNQPHSSIKIHLPIPEEKNIDIENFIRNFDIELYARLDEKMQEKYLEDLDAFALFDYLKELDNQLGLVKLEIHILTDYLEQNNPRLLIGLKQRCSTLCSGRKSTISTRSSTTSTPPTDKSMRSLTNSISLMMGASKKPITEYRISLRTKAEMAEKAALEIDKRVKRIQQKARAEMKEMRIEIQELRYRAEETDKTCKNFVLNFMADDNDVNFLETASERKIIEKLQKFTNHWFKSARGLMAAMRLCISRLDQISLRYRTEFITKSDLSKVLSSIHIEQLMIERKKLLLDIDEKYVHMRGIKNTTGKASIVMSEEKTAMVTLEEKHKEVRKTIYETVTSIRNLEEECKSINTNNKKDLKLLEQMRRKLKSSQSPSVASYVEGQTEIKRLEKEEKMLRRKINILNMKLSNLNKQSRLRKHSAS